MQAIILAAGMGKRLKKLTAGNTKCMVKVNGVTLIERMLTQLDELDLSKIVIVVGYEGKKLIDYVSSLSVKTKLEFIDNPIYDKTNNIYSLSLAKEELVRDDTLLLESDLIFENGTLKDLIQDPFPTLALVDKYESWMDGTVVKLSEDNSIRAFVPGKFFEFDDIPSYYKTVNIYKFGKEFSRDVYVPFLEAYSKALGNNEYYEQVLRVITMLDNTGIKAKKMNGRRWYEIDDIQDLDIAESIFASDESAVSKISSRFGGYWRYPKLIDFCYLVNPYFPPKRLTDEIKANFETLLTQYPSGMRVNSLLVSKNFGVENDYILVGNGAAEIIKSVMERISGKCGFIRPTFEEYANRYSPEDSVFYYPANDDFSYSVSDIKEYFEDKELSALVVVNPDNPSGNYISKADIISLAEWTASRNIRFIYDESFSDFSDERDNTLINDDILEKYDNLIVIKSISKSYGVPGLRLGVVASSNKEFILSLKKDVAIWNINSFAEFYLQISEKYKKDYETAIERFKEARKLFVKNLSDIIGIRVIPTQANYVMIKVNKQLSSKEITERMLIDYAILVKDLSGKIDPEKGQFLRIAIRNCEDNEKLIAALKEILK